MKAISVKQPWANMIADGSKTIETRTWATEYRGELLIVSSRRPDIEPAGCAVATARLVDVRAMQPSDEAAAFCPWLPGLWAWVLEDVPAIEPFPVRGRLGIYEVAIGAGVTKATGVDDGEDE